MTVEFTAAQKNAIGLDALGKYTCVVAGPGSGKTTVLIERFRGLVESGVSPLRILAITFTEKATSQMRQRLAGAFADRPDLTAAIQRAYVSTVHGFCARLLRENAIVAGGDARGGAGNLPVRKRRRFACATLPRVPLRPHPGWKFFRLEAEPEGAAGPD